MGGRALKVVYTRRYELEEYIKIQDELVEGLSNDFPEVAVPLYYNDKSSFGDIDIICTWPDELHPTERGEWLRRYIEETFNPGEIFHNDKSWSFNVEEIQVDMIMSEREDYNAMYHYLSYNDLGNFMGRLAHKLGLKYGQDGLVYDHYFQGSKVGRVLVSTDYPRIFEFLKLDYSRWERGFDTLEDIFEFIAESELFDYDSFQLENLNKINRERNLKRASYVSFLEYIEKNYKDKKHKFNTDKSKHVKEADAFFPEFKYKLETRRMEYEKTKELYMKAKFNGGEIIKRFGITGKELGFYMVKFMEQSFFNNLVLKFDEDVIYESFWNMVEHDRKGMD